MKLERDKIKVLNADVPYSYIYNLSTPYQFRLLQTGRTDVMKSDYFSFCIDGEERSSSETKRIAIYNDSNTAKIAMLINWSNRIGQNIQVDKVPGTGFYLFTKWDEGWTHVKEIIGCILDSNEDICDGETHSLASGIIEITFSKENSNNDCLVVFHTNENQTYYYNPVRDISRLSAYCKECDVLRDRFFTGASTTEYDAILADVFLRTEDEIEQLRNLLLTRSELRAGSRDLSKYVTYVPKNEETIVLIGAITDNDNESGQVIKRKKSSEPEVITNEKTKSLFTILGNNSLNADEIAFVCTATNDGDVEIKELEESDKQILHCKTPDEALRKSFQESEFLKSYCNEHFNNQDKLFVYIAFEGIKLGARGFDSYFFVISNDIEATRDASENAYYALRYLLYLKSENENYANNLARRQSIKSAIGTIMTRNMSHNFGSHFLHYTKQDLSKDNLEKKDIKGAAVSFGFLRDRMGYLASIMEEHPFPNLPVYFNTQVLQPLIGDSLWRNFYLDGIVRSEGYMISDGSLEIEFTGIDNVILSIPGGIISVHAIYNILENFIRNSAKYNRKNTRSSSLSITINTEEHNGKAVFTIYDNKLGDNRTLAADLAKRLEETVFLEKDDIIDKNNKGLKEMLISAFWLNLNEMIRLGNTYGCLGDVLYDWQINEKKRPDLMDNYGFKFIHVKGNDKKDHLGIRFSVPVHRFVADYERGMENTGTNADIVMANLMNDDFAGIENHFVRVVFNSGDKYELPPEVKDTVREIDIDNENSYKFTKSLYRYLNKRYENIDSYLLSADNCDEPGITVSEERKLLFTHHLNLGNFDHEDIDSYSQYPYVESTTGDNSSLAIVNKFTNSIDDGLFKSWLDKYYCLLLKESALTNIAIIDERIFNSVQFVDKRTYEGNIRGTSIELFWKNIQVLNFFENVDQNIDGTFSILGHLKGNSLRDGVEPDFISIHLGIIEKWLDYDNKTYDYIPTLIDKIKTALAPNNQAVHLCIHSGRGTVSEKLRDAIKGYSLIPYSSLEAMYSDSKFMLSQLFHNIIY